jgi:ABC-type transport system involved in multi-copper enzyme maturation permease subunit
MNLALFGHVWRANRLRLAVITIGLAIWGSLMPIIFDAFGSQFQDMFDSGAFPQQLAQFGGGDLFSLTGAVGLGFVHPIAVGLVLVFAVGFTTTAVAGERQRGTLEVLLSRPLSRRTVYATLAVAGALFVGVAMAGLTLGAFAGALLTGRTA